VTGGSNEAIGEDGSTTAAAFPEGSPAAAVFPDPTTEPEAAGDNKDRTAPPADSMRARRSRAPRVKEDKLSWKEDMVREQKVWQTSSRRPKREMQEGKIRKEALVRPKVISSRQSRYFL